MIHALTVAWNRGDPSVEAWLSLWSRAWNHQRFPTTILPISTALLHPLHQNVLNLHFPPNLDQTFERNCFLRWLAAAAWADASNSPFIGLDYDSLPSHHFFPESARHALSATNSLAYLPGHVLLASPQPANAFASAILQNANAFPSYPSDLNAARASFPFSSSPSAESFIPPSANPSWSPSASILHFHSLSPPYNRLLQATRYVEQLTATSRGPSE